MRLVVFSLLMSYVSGVWGWGVCYERWARALRVPGGCLFKTFHVIKRSLAGSFHIFVFINFILKF